MFFEGFTRRLALALLNYPVKYSEDEEFRDNVRKCVFRHSKVMLRFATLMTDQIVSRDTTLRYRMLTQLPGGRNVESLCKSEVVSEEALEYLNQVRKHVVRPFLVKYGFYTPLLEWTLLSNVMSFFLESVPRATVDRWVLNVRTLSSIDEELCCEEAKSSHTSERA